MHQFKLQAHQLLSGQGVGHWLLLQTQLLVDDENAKQATCY